MLPSLSLSPFPCPVRNCMTYECVSEWSGAFQENRQSYKFYYHCKVECEFMFKCVPFRCVSTGERENGVLLIYAHVDD